MDWGSFALGVTTCVSVLIVVSLICRGHEFPCTCEKCRDKVIKAEVKKREEQRKEEAWLRMHREVKRAVDEMEQKR